MNLGALLTPFSWYGNACIKGDSEETADREKKIRAGVA
jgi:hypothetical protein